MSSYTCAAVVGLGRPEVLALGAAMGTPLAFISSLAHSFPGRRTPTLSSCAVQSGHTLSPLGSVMVSGPGQNLSASARAQGGSSPEITPGSMLTSQMWAMSGLSWGRPLAANIRAMASGLPASAPRPYTVSVGNATTSPFFMSSAAYSTLSGETGRISVTPAPP